MVFDWFQRSSVPEGPSGDQHELEPGSPPASQGAGALDLEPSETAGPSQPVPPAPPEPPPGADAGASQASPAVPASPAPMAGVDSEALEWARQAYARLKAQQEANRQQAQVLSPESAPQEPAQALEPQAAGFASEPAPGALGVPPVQDSQSSEPAQAAEVPIGQPAASAGQGLSLLEQAAAQRAERQRQLLALAIEEPAPQGPPGGPSVPSVPSVWGATIAGSVPVGDPAAALPPAAGGDAEPQLGAFDADFTWSAEVLAAQGRRVDQVSLEEIDWLGRLRRGLEKTRRNFVTQLLTNLGDDPLTPEALDELETLLLRADVGVKATDQALGALRERLNVEVVDPSEGIRFLKDQLKELLEAPIRASGSALLAPQRDRLNVWLLVGVNGVGKTTTLGKLANLATRSGYSCLIAAADTFRAAAVEQVRVWGDRSGVPVVSNPSANADPAAVVFDAIGAAQSKGLDLVLVDTAGRLQTKHNLMEELAKVRRIVDRLAPEAAVESLLVLDASQGQNGLRQAMAFAKAAGLTGVVLTKLDGSARGGVALAVASEAGLPIRFIGAGEGIRDLRPFNSFEFIEALLDG